MQHKTTPELDYDWEILTYCDTGRRKIPSTFFRFFECRESSGVSLFKRQIWKQVTLLSETTVNNTAEDQGKYNCETFC